MLELLQTAISPLTLNTKVLSVAYELYAVAPQDSHPVIDLKVVSQRTGVSLLDCRNAIVEANRLGRFPNCSLKS
ncbi:MAG TPA: hypothetical protein V6C65_22445 [Allocoleopsis sp.]